MAAWLRKRVGALLGGSSTDPPSPQLLSPPPPRRPPPVRAGTADAASLAAPSSAGSTLSRPSLYSQLTRPNLSPQLTSQKMSRAISSVRVAPVPTARCGHVFLLHCDTSGVAADAILVPNKPGSSFGVGQVRPIKRKPRSERQGSKAAEGTRERNIFEGQIRTDSFDDELSAANGLQRTVRAYLDADEAYLYLYAAPVGSGPSWRGSGPRVVVGALSEGQIVVVVPSPA